jgi:ribose transport system substrate-binding protein
VKAARLSVFLLFVASTAALVFVAGASSERGAPTKTAVKPNLAYARAQIAKYRPIPRFVAPGPAFNASKARGKTIFNIPVNSGIPICAAIDKSMQDVAKAMGIKFVEFPNQGQPSQWGQGMNQAIARKVNLIVLQCGVEAKLLAPQMAAAKKAGIPVIDTHHDALGTPPAYGLTAKVNVASHQQLALVADWTIADTGGHVNGLIITSDEVSPAKGIRQALVAEYAKTCGSSCKTRVINVPIVDWAAKIQTEVQSALIADPTINYVLPIFDGMSQFAVPAVVASGRKGKVKIATSDGSPFVLKYIQDKNVVVMDIGKSPAWAGYANMDQAMRILAGVRPLSPSTLYYPYRIWSSINVADAGNPPSYRKGYGQSYVAGYKKLWGVTK